MKPRIEIKHLTPQIARLTSFWLAVVTYWIYQSFATDLDIADADSRSFPNEILEGRAPSPYRYRIGAPLLARVVEMVPGVGTGAAHKCVMLLAFVVLFESFRSICNLLGLSLTQQFAAGCFLVAPLVLTFQVTLYTPWAIVEASLLCLSTQLLLTRTQLGLLALALSVWSLTRETVAFFLFALILLSLLRATRTRFPLRRTVALVGPPLAVQFVLRLVWPGPAPYRSISVREVFEYNIEGVVGGAIAVSLLAPLFALACAEAYFAHKAGSFGPIHTLWLGVSSANFGGFLVFAIWWETRVLIPAIVMSALMSAKFFARIEASPSTSIRVVQSRQ